MDFSRVYSILYGFITEIVEVGAKSEVKCEVLVVIDMLVIADYVAAGLQLMGSHVYSLQEGEGMQHVIDLLGSNAVDLLKYKFLILLCGKEDLMGTESVFKDTVHNIMLLAHKKNPQIMLVFTAMLPLPGDTRLQIRMGGFRAGFLSRLAEENNWIEFSKPGKCLLQPGGVSPEFFFADGMLNK